MDDKRIVNVLWTGGYDSSFRMVELSKMNINIQPYYLCDNRKSEKMELNAISAITEDIRNHPGTEATILPLIKYNSSDIKENEEITKSYERLREKTKLGSQYDWLSRFAKEKNISGLELSLEKAETSIAQNCIKQFGQVKLIKEDKISYYIIDKMRSSDDLIKIFGDFHFPNPLFNMTKREMLVEYENLGFKDIIGVTWFCFNPIDDAPCGICNPCKSTLKEGMNFRFTKEGLKRNKYSLFYRIIFKIKRTLGIKSL